MLTAASNGEVEFSSILTCLATHQPFLNVPDYFPICWLLIQAFKTYYNSSRLINKSLPNHVVIPVFWMLTFIHLIFVDPSRTKGVIMILYLLVFSIATSNLIDQDLGPLDGGQVVVVIAGNFFAPLRFIWDVIFVAFVLAELYEEARNARNWQLDAIFLIIGQIPFLVASHFLGKPGAGLEVNRLSFCLASFVLGIMAGLGLHLQNPLNQKVAYLVFVFYVRLPFIF